MTIKSLQKFLDENSYPTISEFDERAESRLFLRSSSALILFWVENTKSMEWKQTIEELAPLIKKRVQVLIKHSIKKIPKKDYYSKPQGWVPYNNS